MGKAMTVVPKLIVCAALALVITASSALAQEGTLKHVKKPPTANSKTLNSPVTQAEAAAIFEKLDRIMHEVLIEMPSKPVLPMPKGDVPISRAMIIKQYDRLFGMAKSIF